MTGNVSPQEYAATLGRLRDLAVSRHTDALALPTIASPSNLQQGIDTLPTALPSNGWGFGKTSDFLLQQITDVLAPGHNGTRYFGFVTGGVTPIATVADILTTLYDPNVQVHLPKETLSTLIEVHTVNLLCQLLSLPTSRFTGTITTGATASNLLGLACGREEILKRAMARTGYPNWSMAENGNGADSDDGDETTAPPPVNVYVATPHASIKKAAGIIGIGRKRVFDVGQKAPWSSSDLMEEEDVKASMSIVEFDLVQLEVSLRGSWYKKQGAIVVVGLGEVNTGALSVQIPAIRALCDRYEAWLHIDAAFSAFCCLLDGFEWISEHLAMADSICSDGHKQLNVPYDAGLFFIRKEEVGELRVDSLLEDVCGLGKMGAPAYLATGGPEESTEDVSPEVAKRREYAANLPSPLFRNLENSKRFRALPLYATLLSEGRQGIKTMVQRNVSFARSLEAWMRSPEGSRLYQVLTPPCEPLPGRTSSASSSASSSPKAWHGPWSSTILLFRPHPLSCPISTFRHPLTGADACIAALKATRAVYVSPTRWCGLGAVRLAVSNWRTGLEDARGERVQRVEDSWDWEVTVQTLKEVMQVQEGEEEQAKERRDEV